MRILLRARRPLSHQELMGRLGEADVDRVTVYRTLHRLVEAGLLHEALVDGRQVLYETADRCHESHCHAHFTCRVCNRTYCLTEAKVTLVEGVGDGFIAERQKVLIEGRCPQCAGTV